MYKMAKLDVNYMHFLDAVSAKELYDIDLLDYDKHIEISSKVPLSDLAIDYILCDYSNKRKEAGIDPKGESFIGLNIFTVEQVLNLTYIFEYPEYRITIYIL